jgi:urease accessory protein
VNSIPHALHRPPREWLAELRLRFALSHGRTRLAEAAHLGPLRIQRLFHPAGSAAHCYLLHPPGGVAAGDRLNIDIAVDSGDALITTPSAGRFYRVGDYTEPQSQHVTLRCADGARLAWLPQESIVFSGANTTLHTRIDLEGSAALAFWDVLVLGCPASDERFDAGRCRQHLQIYRDGRLELSELMRLTAGDRFHRSPLGLHGASTVGLFAVTAVVDQAFCRHWQEDLNADAAAESAPFSITQRGALVLTRYLGEDAAAARAGFTRLWQALEALQQRDAVLPRIWHT